MEGGHFTGVGLARFLPARAGRQPRPVRLARKIINGADRADLVAGYALTFQDALALGGWG
jgi:hypothetical protein